jgi:hypothetical protein
VVTTHTILTQKNNVYPTIPVMIADEMLSALAAAERRLLCSASRSLATLPRRGNRDPGSYWALCRSLNA